MNVFAAVPGTYLIEREQGSDIARRVPVIAFTHIQGGIVFPVCAVNHGGLTLGRALVTPDGFVTDPTFNVVCGTVEEWMTLTKSPAYWSGATVVG